MQNISEEIIDLFYEIRWGWLLSAWWWLVDWRAATEEAIREKH
jgi:hypothetical protein